MRKLVLMAAIASSVITTVAMATTTMGDFYCPAPSKIELVPDGNGTYVYEAIIGEKLFKQPEVYAEKSDQSIPLTFRSAAVFAPNKGTFGKMVCGYNFVNHLINGVGLWLPENYRVHPDLTVSGNNWRRGNKNGHVKAYCFSNSVTSCPAYLR